MSRHRFELLEFVDQIADERGCDPDDVQIQDVTVSAKRGEIIIDALEERDQ